MMRARLAEGIVSGVAASVVIVGLAAVACGDLKQAPGAEPDAGAIDAAPPPSDGEVARDAEADALGDGRLDDSPPDSACAEPWTVATKTNPACAARRVALVESGLVDVAYVSIARTGTGRVGVLYNTADVEEDDLHLSHFVEGAAWPPVFARATIARGFTYHVGVRGRLVAPAADTLHVVEHEYVDDGPGDLVTFRLEGGALPFTTPEPIASGVPRGTHLGAALSTSGTLAVTWYNAPTAGDAGATGAVTSAIRPQGGSFRVDNVELGLTPNAPGTGQSSIAVDGAGAAHVLVHHCAALTDSTPRYYGHSGVAWSNRRTVDSLSSGGFVGFDPTLMLFGAQKLAVYFSRGVSATTAELRLSVWSLAGDPPSATPIATAIPAPVAAQPAYRAAAAVDRWGLVHVALVRPAAASDGGVAGDLVYLRQTRAQGTVQWLTDVIAPGIVSDLSESRADITVDARGRPHIAFRSGADGAVYYATRTDR